VETNSLRLELCTDCEVRYLALACDYDGTLAEDGQVADSTVAALGRLRKSGRKLLLVSGRQLDDLIGIFPQIHLFDVVVAENGAVLYEAATRDVQSLVDPPPEEFVQELRAARREPPVDRPRDRGNVGAA
jgi:HAD superfamily hydrolase (TIGR01484 family)